MSVREPNAEQMEKFLESIAWKYIASQLSKRLEDTRTQMESAPLNIIRDIKSETVVVGIEFLQGVTESLRYCIELPVIHKEELVENELETEESNNGKE